MLSQDYPFRCRIEKDSGDAGADVELKIPGDRHVESERDLLGAVVQVDHVDVEPALEKTVAKKVEILNVACPFGHYGTIGCGELAEPFGKPIPQNHLGRAGEIQGSGRQMHGVDEVVESDRSRQPILDVRPNQIGFDAAKPSRR